MKHCFMSKIKKKIKVGVIFGGQSGEHEVSIVSAQSVMSALAKNRRYEVIPIGITKDGRWIAGRQALSLLKAGANKLPFKFILPPDPTEKRLVRVEEKSLKPARGKIQFQELDVIFPVLHGTLGEDGAIQGMLELANIPYVGSGVLGSAVGMDKIIQKQLFKQAGLPIVDYVWFLTKLWQKNQPVVIKQIETALTYPVFTKPANSGSSVGIGKCHNRRELILGLKDASLYDRKILVEQGIDSIQEIEVAVLGNDLPQASVPGEIIASNEFYDYDAKYVDGKSRAIIPAKLPVQASQAIRQTALAAFKTLDLAGLARVDFFVKKGSFKIYLNEVNTIPGFTTISMYPKLWQASGLSYAKLLDRLIQLALTRQKEKNKLSTSYQPKADWYR